MDSCKTLDVNDELASAEWIAEIDKRAKRALSGEEPGVDFDEAIKRLERELELTSK